MNTEPPGDDGSDLGEVIRFDVVDHGLTAPLLAVRLAEQQAAVPKLVVDLSEVSFLGSAGLAALVEAKDAADRDGSRLLVVPGSRIVKRALEATGLLSLFTVADDVPEALGAR
jgi:anti-sigma B factor antagonist